MADPIKPADTKPVPPVAPVAPAAAAPIKPVVAEPKPFKVKATAKGYYGGIIREYGDTFTIAKDEDFASWMEVVDSADAKRLDPVIVKNAATRKPTAPPGTKPTPATQLR